jgi:hypothetical protein
MGERMRGEALLEWLKTHEYIATWVGPVVGLAVGVFETKKQHQPIDIFQVMLWITFFLSLSIAFNSTFDSEARSTC